MRQSNDKPRGRERVLIVAHADQFVEIFAGSNVDAKIVRCPVAHSREAEQMAEDVMELTLPQRYHDLYRADRLRATDTTRPLLPSTLANSLVVRDCLAAFNTLADDEQEVMTWTF